MQDLVGIGMLLIFIGIIIVFLGMMQNAKEGKAKFAVGGFIGFIPFGFGNDRNLVRFAAIVSLALFLAWVFFSFIVKGTNF